MYFVAKLIIKNQPFLFYYDACNDHFLIIVAKKPLNVTAKWITSSKVLVTWSPPVNNNPLIDGYEVFYGVNDCDCKTFSVGVTNNSELIINGLCSNQNYSFFVVSYSNENNTLPSEWSDITTLIASKFIGCSLKIASFLSLHNSLK